MTKSIANQTDFTMNVDAGGVTTIIQVTNINGPGISRDAIDVTDLNDTWKEFLMDIPDGGEVSIDVIYDPSHATHIYFYDMLDDTAVTPCTIVYSDAGSRTVVFSGYLQNFTPQANRGESLAATFTLKVSGAVTQS